MSYKPKPNDIQLVAVNKAYGSFAALDNIELKIAEGEFLTLLGPSGSGKSTLLMTLAGFVEPTDGNILLGGQSILDLLPEQRDFGVVFQGYALFPHMTVAENLAYPLKVRKTAAPEIAAKVRQTLELVQLGHLADRYPRQLSGGQQQRVALARALVFSPRILLLDEPMGALDKNLRQDLQAELRQLHRRLGCTFVNVTHDQEEAMAMSDNIAIMNKGRIIQVGPPSELYNAPKNRFVAAFLGKSNFMEGKLVAVAEGMATVETANGIVRHAIRGDEALTVGDKVTLALRPQKIRLGSGPNTLRATAISAIFLGTHAEIALRTDLGLDLAMQIPQHCDSARYPMEGEKLEIHWDPSATVALQPE
ncbi:ABC transporter ATP-binding protein [Achromobacter aloeverae]